jgi:aldehyde:ferredoxin oxidoreductase
VTVNSRFIDKKDKSSTLPEVLLLGRSEIEELLSMGEALKAVEHSFRLKAEGETTMPPKLYLNLPHRMLNEPLQDAGPATGEVIRKLDTLLDEYYDAFGYTRQGVPTVERLRELGLDGVIKDIEKFVR